jgi:hypothetical protein
VQVPGGEVGRPNHREYCSVLSGWCRRAVASQDLESKIESCAESRVQSPDTGADGVNSNPDQRRQPESERKESSIPD